MNISALARSTGVSADTLRYYEKQKLLDVPERQNNGYRSYTDTDIQRVRFIRSAQLLGFSLAEIRETIPKLNQGTFGRADIEQRLTDKIAQIDAHIKALRLVKKDLIATFDSLSCQADTAVSIVSATTVSVTDENTPRRIKTPGKPPKIIKTAH